MVYFHLSIFYGDCMGSVIDFPFIAQNQDKFHYARDLFKQQSTNCSNNKRLR